jgi:hypothetical protein
MEIAGQLGFSLKRWLFGTDGCALGKPTRPPGSEPRTKTVGKRAGLPAAQACPARPMAARCSYLW